MTQTNQKYWTTDSNTVTEHTDPQNKQYIQTAKAERVDLETEQSPLREKEPAWCKTCRPWLLIANNSDCWMGYSS